MSKRKPYTSSAYVLMFIYWGIAALDHAIRLSDDPVDWLDPIYYILVAIFLAILLRDNDDV